jgi:hypothetical protein
MFEIIIKSQKYKKSLDFFFLGKKFCFEFSKGVIHNLSRSGGQVDIFDKCVSSITALKGDLKGIINIYQIKKKKIK